MTGGECLLACYNAGFNDELDSISKNDIELETRFKEMVGDNKLLKVAYDLGKMDAIMGDDNRSLDYQTGDQII